MKTVLIVDDSKTFQKLLERTLTAQFKVLAKGSSGQEGFDLYKSLLPDCVLMDITMPNCNGKEALKMIRDFNPLAKVIMVSGIGDDATVAECLKMGAVAFVRKELLTQDGGKELISIIQKALKIENVSRTVGAA